ncbi:uncharacterized protein [Drosophila pseudoobscura]|uniref:Endonuclease/exonuclease/phosphatase domain-containing protein n=1 Tax=Drosophila pseudoobscura pseudoobscura TaxID=46245 RepID=A0A6I8W6T8_DROPS|nr:uncharacterized protein LOC117184643 [Drosophila pseudoobscura]
MAHEEDHPPNDLVRKISSDSERTGKDLLIGCDANAHHTQWGSKDTNVRDTIKSWKVLGDHFFSDHRYIETILSFEIPKPTTISTPEKPTGKNIAQPWRNYSLLTPLIARTLKTT